MPKGVTLKCVKETKDFPWLQPKGGTKGRGEGFLLADSSEVINLMQSLRNDKNSIIQENLQFSSNSAFVLNELNPQF